VVAPVADALAVACIVEACYRSEKDRGACIEVTSA
jgi:hypothetical protein